MTPKTVLIYLGHPAHFHLFKVVIKNLEAKSIKVVIAIKTKDVLEELLISSGLKYVNIAPVNKKKAGTKGYVAFAKRLFNLGKLIRKTKPGLMMGTSPEIAVLGKIFGVISHVYSEDDLEVISSFAKVAGPFATNFICPNCCSAWKWNDKKIGHDSYHELAYLHPNHFTPDPEKVKSIFNLNERNFILRFVQLTAYHDIGKSGITTELAQKIIDILSPNGKIFITSERELEPQFEKYRIRIPPAEIHHALYYADMCIGDSQTMTAEAAVLGTPAIRFNDFVGVLAYLEELEHKYHLTYGFKTDKPDAMFAKIKELVETPNLKQEWAKRRAKMLTERIDFAQWMTNLVETTLNKK